MVLLTPPLLVTIGGGGAEMIHAHRQTTHLVIIGGTTMVAVAATMVRGETDGGMRGVDGILRDGSDQGIMVMSAVVVTSSHQDGNAREMDAGRGPI